MKNTTSRLRHLVTLQKEVRVSDTAGGYTKTWQDVAKIWAEIIAASFKETLFGNKLQADITHRVLIRYRDDITADMRLVFDNRVFNIRGIVDEHENNNVLQLLAQEGVAT